MKQQSATFSGLRDPYKSKVPNIIYTINKRIWKKVNPETAYEDSVYEQIKTVREKKGLADFTNALKSGHTWTVS